MGHLPWTIRGSKSAAGDHQDDDQEDNDQPEVVATIELDGGIGRGTIRVHQEDGQWLVTCAGPDGWEKENLSIT